MPGGRWMRRPRWPRDRPRSRSSSGRRCRRPRRRCASAGRPPPMIGRGSARTCSASGPGPVAGRRPCRRRRPGTSNRSLVDRDRVGPAGPGPRRRRQLERLVERHDDHPGALPGNEREGDVQGHVAEPQDHLGVGRPRALRDAQGRLGDLPVHRAGGRDRGAEGREPGQREAVCRWRVRVDREPASLELEATERRGGTVVVDVRDAHRSGSSPSARRGTPASTSTRSSSSPSGSLVSCRGTSPSRTATSAAGRGSSG